ncbi:MAG: hypothetical protein AAFO95_14395 [Cyanobacteria bacterium J06600_6]
MSDRLGMVCGFMGGTIVGVEGGYKVFPHPKPDKIYNRISDAKWFLALRWCDSLDTPAGIINNTGELAFFNQIVLKIGSEKFIPQQYRLQVFEQCLPLQPNETLNYQLPQSDRLQANTNLEIQALLVDSRYGKVALVRGI